jgi:hypothetical protein
MFSYGNFQSELTQSPQCYMTIVNSFIPSQRFPLKKSSFKAIVDTGAVATVVPEERIRDFGGNIVYSGKVGIRTADGNTAEPDTYIVRLQIVDDILNPRQIIEIPRPIQIIAIPNKKYALIGRDILNEYKVVLDAINRNAHWRLNCHGSCDIH